MADSKAYYITTPIYYINAQPHIGNSYTTIVADTIARFQRLRGREVLFATGTDEHAEKVIAAAEAAGMSPREYSDGLAERFREAWARLDITYDDFIRTSEPRHYRVVQELFSRLIASGDIYKGQYEGWYCVSCATFFSDGDVEGGGCPNAECGKPVERRKQAAYFFRASAYADRLLEHIASNPDFVQPAFRRNEVVSFVGSGLRDCCVSRPSNGWGIPVPGDPEHQVYVWCDALINYLTVTGWPDDEETYRRTWPADIHIMAKDILPRFHATLWPAMLMALGVPLPSHVVAHGFWTIGGKKISKSAGVFVAVDELAEELQVLVPIQKDVAYDTVRYFCLREMTFGQDADFTREAYWGRINSDLANDLGNVLNRSLPLIERGFGGVVPDGSYDTAVAEAVDAAAKAIPKKMESLDFRGALEAIWAAVAALNKYLDTLAPWNLVHEPDQGPAKSCLLTVCEGIRRLSVLLLPFVPHAAMEIRRQLGLPEAPEGTLDAELQGGERVSGVAIARGNPIFPRVKIPKQAPAAQPESAAEPKPYITYDDFMKIDLRVGTCLTAQKVPGADKLYQLTVDIGTEVRQLVAGVAHVFPAEDLVGKRLVIVTNLEPRAVRGVESRGMILAAGEKDPVGLVTLDRDVSNGERVR